MRFNQSFAVALALTVFALTSIACAGNGSSGGGAVKVTPKVVEVEQAVVVDVPAGTNAKVTESVTINEGGTGSQPPAYRHQRRDANKECRETKKAARFSHKAYRAGRKEGAAAAESTATEAARDAYSAAKQ